MKYKGIAILVLMVLTSYSSFGQKAMTRSLSQSKEIKTTKTKTMVGAFGEILTVEEEDIKSERHFDLAEKVEEPKRHFDLVEDNVDYSMPEEALEETTKDAELMNVMVINERKLNQTPPKSEAFLFHTAKKITKESGFYIQLVETSDILDKDHKIYQEFGNLRVEENNDDIYCYLIGNFKSKETVDKFLNDIILSRYPEAKVIELKKGKRL